MSERGVVPVSRELITAGVPRAVRSIALAAGVALAIAAPGSGLALTPGQKAQLFHRWAEEAVSDSSVEGRQRALRHLREAIEFEPDNPEHWLLLGRIKLLGEYRQEARDCFRRAVVIDPKSLAGYIELGMCSKRDWLRSLDTLALERAIAEFDSAAALKPRASDPWLQLVALHYERSDFDRAASAAERAVAGRPRRAEAGLAVAYVAYRRGEIERADSAFRVTIPRLHPTLRALFEDPSPFLGGDVRVTGRGGWDRFDPDPTTPQNETQLEYWSRVAHAFLTFHDPVRPGLDARAETYIRYGPPRNVEINPPGVALSFKPFTSGYHRGSGAQDFPMHVVAWHYPELGMRVVLQDRSLHGEFAPAATPDFDPTSVPNPSVLARRDDLRPMGGGVFPTLPPRAQRLEVEGVIARFEGERGPRLFAQVEASGSPADTLAARWVVTDTTGRMVSRGTQTLGIAGCDPAERRQAQFSADLPAGAYRVAVSVRGPRHRRGLFETGVALGPRASALALSDLVLACGDPGALVGSGSARFDANVGARVRGTSPLVAYLEIYRLAPGADGTSRFEYECVVRRSGARAGPRRQEGTLPALISMSREEVHQGGIRRQFISVSTQQLLAGRYRLEVRVRDLVTGAVAERYAEFERE